MTLADEVIATRRKANRLTLDIPNEIRADIMNNIVGAKDLEISKYPDTHMVSVHVTFIDGREKNWMYTMEIRGLEFAIVKEAFSKDKIKGPAIATKGTYDDYVNDMFAEDFQNEVYR